MRIDAFYERTLRSLVKECQSDDNPVIAELCGADKGPTAARRANIYGLAFVVDQRLLGATRGIVGFRCDHLELVQKEVNRLKHDVLGQPPAGDGTHAARRAYEQGARGDGLARGIEAHHTSHVGDHVGEDVGQGEVAGRS
jgi:hypothetical protein